MSRTIVKVAYSCGFDAAQNKVTAILSSNGFAEKTIGTGETVWKKGNGLMSAMKYVKVEYAPNEVVLSAWVQVGIGSIGGGEMDLTGVAGALPKKQLMNVLDEIKQRL